MSGRQVSVAVHGGESSPLVKRRRRVVESPGSDTEIDPESTMLDDLEQESQVAAQKGGALTGGALQGGAQNFALFFV